MSGGGGGVRIASAAGKRSRRKAGTVIDACGLERASRSRRWRATRRTMCAKPVLISAGNRSLGKAPHVEGVEPMGRGRAKAKQVKVARQLKYNSGGTDLDRLRTELGVGEGGQDNNDHASSDLADRYSDFDEYDGEENGDEAD